MCTHMDGVIPDAREREPEEDVERTIGGKELDEDRLSAFKDFVNSLDLDDLDDEEE